jgi:hypothetical protein
MRLDDVALGFEVDRTGVDLALFLLQCTVTGYGWSVM